jgi:beta-mannosidase
MEWGWVDWGWKGAEFETAKVLYDKFFHHTLPAWITAEDTDHAYWPSSPSSDTPFIDPNGQKQGDSHYWMCGMPKTLYRLSQPISAFYERVWFPGVAYHAHCEDLC